MTVPDERVRYLSELCDAIAGNTTRATSIEHADVALALRELLGARPAVAILRTVLDEGRLDGSAIGAVAAGRIADYDRAAGGAP